MQREDYEEPECLLNMEPEVRSIPIGRILEKLDRYLNAKNYDGAERLLENWRKEADAGHNMRGKLAVLNEEIGLFRKTGKKADCLRVIGETLAITEELGLSETVTGATAYVNAATGYKAFNMADRAVPLYEKAREIYGKALDAGDSRIPALYNNMALAHADLGNFREADALYKKALDAAEKNGHMQAECAVTYLNMADLAAMRFGEEEAEASIREYLDRAEALLDSKDIPRDDSYAFICEKCAPVFDYYGYFFTKEKLEERAREIYEGP